MFPTKKTKCILKQSVTQDLAEPFREEEEARSIEKAPAPRTQWLIYCIRWAWTGCLSGLNNFSYQTCAPERPISDSFTGRNIIENWDVLQRVSARDVAKPHQRAGEVWVDIEG